MTGEKCKRCGCTLHTDEKALYRKLIFREAREYLCLDCLSSDLSTTRQRLEDLIALYHRRGGCSLFAKWE